MPHLTRTETVMVRLDKRYPTFGQADEEGRREHVVRLDPQVWADMGEPETITVTVRPGDHLNPHTEKETP